MHTFADAFRFIAHNGSLPGYTGLPTLVHLTLLTLKVAFIGIAVSVAIALPIGVWLGHLHRGSFAAVNVGNLGRALPSLAVLAIGVAVLGLGLATVELALVVLAVPPILTNAYTAVDGVEPELVDAARGMGMTDWQVLRRVELPLSIPLLFAGIRTAAVYVVATTTIASLTGYPGTLGDVIANEASYRLSGVIGAAICIAALALTVEGALALLQRALTPRGLRLARARSREAPAPGLGPASVTP
jgi:osmoprotectant transport system permease protein